MSDFNSWFKKKFRDLHDAILCGDLVAGNYKKVSKKSYEAGQQSRQKEIDELQSEIEGYKKIYGELEVQKNRLNTKLNSIQQLLEDEVIEVDYDEYRFVGNFIDADKVKEILK